MEIDNFAKLDEEENSFVERVSQLFSFFEALVL